MRPAKSTLRGVLAVALTLVGAPAFATDTHTKPEVKPIKKGDKVVGFKMKMILKPDGTSPFVRIGLGRMKAPDGTRQAENFKSRLRDLAGGDLPGYLHVQFPEIEGVNNTEPREVEYQVIYGEGNDLKSGDKVDVVSAWRQPQYSNASNGGVKGNFFHVYGMHDGPVNSGDHEQVILLP
jgi:hypothetical protein